MNELDQEMMNTEQDEKRNAIEQEEDVLFAEIARRERIEKVEVEVFAELLSNHGDHLRNFFFIEIQRKTKHYEEMLQEDEASSRKDIEREEAHLRHVFIHSSALQQSEIQSRINIIQQSEENKREISYLQKSKVIKVYKQKQEE